jgi:hypothetical protein
LKKIVLTLLLFLLALPLVLAQDSFQTFSPESKEFTVLLPGKVTNQEMREGDLTLMVHTAQDGQTIFVVEEGVPIHNKSGSELDEFSQGVLNGIRTSAQEKGLTVEVQNTKECSGSGWSGKRYDLKFGNAKQSALIALSDNKDVVYTLLIVNGDQTTTDKFFNSLSINAKAASPGKVTYIILAGLFVLAFILGMIKIFSSKNKQTQSEI